MLHKLEETSSMISLEAYCSNESLSNAVSKLPDFIGQLRGFFASKVGEPLSQNFNGNRPQKFIHAVVKTTYTDFKQVHVFVPQGMSVTYLAHQKVLKASCDHVLAMEEKVLDPLIKWLSERIGNPQSFASVSSTAKQPSGNCEDLEKKYQECFIANGQKQSEVPYMSAVARQNDWVEIINGTEAMEKQMSSEIHGRLLTKMARLDDLLSTLIRRMVESPDTYKFSPPALADLATSAYVAARELEFYGLTKNRLETYTVAVRDTVKKLEVFVK